MSNGNVYIPPRYVTKHCLFNPETHKRDLSHHILEEAHGATLTDLLLMILQCAKLVEKMNLL